MMRTIGHWIAGAQASGGNGLEVLDPATGAVQATVELADPAVVDRAVAAARTAFPGWRDLSVTRRADVLFRYRDLVAAAADDLALAISREHGKTIDDARGEITRGLENIQFACGVATHQQGAHTRDISSGVDTWSVHEPLGVVVGITPFNFPAMVPLWMFPLAVACGNTFVLKPSERDPSASVLLAELFAEAGLPPGVLNVVHGGREAAEVLIDHPDTAAVSFVGSTPAARAVYERASARGKRVQALGGAKNHMVVMPDADLDAAAAAAISAGFGSAGQRCMAISAVVAVGGIGDALVARIDELARGVVVGPHTDERAEMGPVITGAQRDRLVSAIGTAEVEGATIATDGRTHDLPDGAGFWIGPTVLDHVTPAMACHREELFGPVLCVMRVDTLADAITLINDLSFANGTAIFTRDGAAARAFERGVQVGMVGVNVPIPVPAATYSFGGWKQSLFGAAHVYGPDGVRFHTRTKQVTSRWGSYEDDAALAFPANDR